MQDIKLPKLICCRCNYEWIPRKADYPRRCPDCGSPYWDKPRKPKKAA